MNIQTLTDRTSIALSIGCAIHCLAIPVLLVLIPSIAALPFTDEAFHQYALFAVIPISLLAFITGCRKHKRFQILSMGLGGLMLMLVAALFGHDYLGEAGEKVLTLLGAALLAFSHVKNNRACQQNAYRCHSEDLATSLAPTSNNRD